MGQVVPEGNQKWGTASFLIVGDRFKLGEIDTMLGLKPTRVVHKGDQISPNLSSAKRRFSVWMLKSPLADDHPLDAHLKWLLDTLEPKTGSVRLLAKMYKLEFFCGFSSENGQGGFTLDNQTLARIANLGIALSLDLHPPGPVAEPSETSVQQMA